MPQHRERLSAVRADDDPVRLHEIVDRVPLLQKLWIGRHPERILRQTPDNLANAIGLNPILTASVNSAAGVMGKMISVQSIAVAVAATGMTRADESRLFRFTIKHSVLLMIAMGIISMLFAYVFPGAVPTVP